MANDTPAMPLRDALLALLKLPGYATPMAIDILLVEGESAESIILSFLGRAAHDKTNPFAAQPPLPALATVAEALGLPVRWSDADPAILIVVSADGTGALGKYLECDAYGWNHGGEVYRWSPAATRSLIIALLLAHSTKEARL